MSELNEPRQHPLRHPVARRQLLQAGTLALLLGAQHIARGASILAVRVWPSQDYTRVTIETDVPHRRQAIPDSRSAARGG